METGISLAFATKTISSYPTYLMLFNIITFLQGFLSKFLEDRVINKDRLYKKSYIEGHQISVFIKSACVCAINMCWLG